MLAPTRTILFVVAAACAAAAGISPQRITSPRANFHPRTEHNTSRSPIAKNRSPFKPVVRLAKRASASQMQWVQTNSTDYYYSAGQWSLNYRDTCIYNAQGRLAVTKESLAARGWSIDSLYSIDSTVWNGSLMTEVDTLAFWDGALDSASCFRSTFFYSLDRKTFVETDYFYGADAWEIFGVDSLVCSLPISDPNFNYSNDSSKFISRRYYSLSDTSGKLELVSGLTRINTESNDTSLVLLSIGSNAGTPDSSKIYEKLSSYDLSIIADSTIAKDSTGAWVNEGRSTYGYDANGNWKSRSQTCQGGVWGTYDSLTDFRNGGGFEIYHSPVDSSLDENFWDMNGYDTLEVTAQGSDTSYLHWINTYDLSANLIASLGYSSDKSGVTKTKSDSAVYAYSQINAIAVRTSRAAAAPSISFTQTALVLRIAAPAITGVRLYDVAGHLIASITQSAAPSLTLDLRQTRTPLAAGLYLAQVSTKNGILLHRVSITR